MLSIVKSGAGMAQPVLREREQDRHYVHTHCVNPILLKANSNNLVINLWKLFVYKIHKIRCNFHVVNTVEVNYSIQQVFDLYMRSSSC